MDQGWTLHIVHKQAHDPMKSWLLPSILVVLSVLCPFLLFKVQHYTQEHVALGAPAGAVYYFYNEVCIHTAMGHNALPPSDKTGFYRCCNR